MYVCICHNITEDKVKSCLSKGLSPKETVKSLGIGHSCGVCVIDAIEKIGNEMNNSQSSNSKQNVQAQKVSAN